MTATNATKLSLRAPILLMDHPAKSPGEGREEEERKARLGRAAHGLFESRPGAQRRREGESPLSLRLGHSSTMVGGWTGGMPTDASRPTGPILSLSLRLVHALACLKAPSGERRPGSRPHTTPAQRPAPYATGDSCITSSQ
ncbi:hypothetical protein JDV02_004770 [Purpureocillium takamizusanense]|uniref:Uncharacterized protein n=1 Tax=Purpureocillium takamizusanense TaxID=2060973 RepID=A0A9Q8QEJ0_9HYPO|nr:uncharacterized protein JDV02_004770 [Purpureocillium takamizusanense]UNI18503.1 hypothetical protein JDV02_004770 [Purpureocillium takamizusanense]